MGYHNAREIPNYWTYAKYFVLDDHMFEPDASWSLPAHLYMVSEWSAHCLIKGDPKSCVNDDEQDAAPTAHIVVACARTSSGSRKAAPSVRRGWRGGDSLRSPTGQHPRRPSLRHQPDQHDHARPQLELDRDLFRAGRLGRLLRPCDPTG